MSSSTLLLVGTVGVLGVGGYLYLRNQNKATGVPVNQGNYRSPSPATQFPWSVAQATRMDNQNMPWTQGSRAYSQGPNDLAVGAQTAGAVADAGNSLADLWNSLFGNTQDLSANYNMDTTTSDFQSASDGNSQPVDGGFGFAPSYAGDGSDAFTSYPAGATA